MKKSFLFFTLILLGVHVFADSATVVSVKGKVEVSRDGQWISLKAGDSVLENELLSTGFSSEAKLKYKGSLIQLGPVTRAKVTEMSSSTGKEKVSLYLNTGAVRSKVEHTKETRVDYKINTPVAVASVRGTDFEFFANGNIICTNGAVAVASIRDLSEGRFSSQSNEEDESEENSDEQISDNEPASSTTLAQDISQDMPRGSVVVGAGQNTGLGSSGKMTLPFNSKITEVNSGQKPGATQAQKESVSLNPARGKDPQSQQKGNLKVDITIAE